MANTHDRLEKPIVVNGATIIQSGCHGAFVGRLDLSVERETVRVERHELVAMDETTEPDLVMSDLVEALVSPMRDHLAIEVGSVDAALHRNTILDCSMDDILLAALQRLGSGNRLLEWLAIRRAGCAWPHQAQRSLEHHTGQSADLDGVPQG